MPSAVSNYPTDAQRKTSFFARCWLDVVILVFIAATYCLIIQATTSSKSALYWDTYRDTGAAENILAGKFWQDSVIKDMPPWYPPLNPLIMAGVSKITGVSVIDVYASSRYWFNVWIPVLLYVLVRMTFGRMTALLSLFFVLFCSCWWIIFIAAPLPAIHGVVFNLAGLICWLKCAKGGLRWLLLTALFLTVAVWHHPVCSLLFAGVIFVHAVHTATDKTQPNRFALMKRMIAIAAITGILTLPFTIHTLLMPKINLDPFHYVSPYLYSGKYVFYSHMLAIPAIGFVGLWRILKNQRDGMWLVAYWLISLAGQFVGYANDYLGWPVPFMVPHEFQIHGQLVFGIMAAVGASWLISVVFAKKTAWPKRAGAGLAILIVALSVTFGTQQLPHPRKLATALTRFRRIHGEATEWIRQNTDINTVFVAAKNKGFFIINGFTGRKCVSVGSGHVNPAVDAQQRADDLKAMIETDDPEQFKALANQYEAEYFYHSMDRKHRKPIRWDTYPTWPNLKLVFESKNGMTRIYRIMPSNTAK